jgi:predicted phage terminase large subunit-like protein
VLNFWWLCWEPHKAFADEIQADQHLSLYLFPRGHCKSLLFTEAHSIQCYLRDPEEPIFILSYSVVQAIKKLLVIKNQFESNATFRELFPEFGYGNPKKDAKKWTEEEIVLPGHTGRQESSISAYSILSMPTGLHSRRIKCDDLITPENSTSREQMQKISDAYGMVRSSILQPDGNIQICGTIYDDGDLHRDMERSGAYNVYKRSASYEVKAGEEIPCPPESPRAKALWPVQYPLSVQIQIKNDPTVGDYIYSCQYLLDPSPEDENAFFQLAWFGRYKEAPTNLTLYAAADLAISQRETAAFTAIPVVGVDPNFKIYILHVLREHWDGMQIVDNLILTQKVHKPVLFGIEVENIERTIGPFLQRRMQEEEVYLNLEEFTPSTDKIARARSIQGRAKQGMIILPENGPNQPVWLADFEYELKRFPRARTKDQVDSLSLIGLMVDKVVSLYRAPKPEKKLSDAHIDAVIKGGRDPYELRATHDQAITWRHLEQDLKKRRGDGKLINTVD